MTKNLNLSRVETNVSTHRLEPSTSTAIYKQDLHNRDERFVRSFLQWVCYDISIDESLGSNTESSTNEKHFTPVLEV